MIRPTFRLCAAIAAVMCLTLALDGACNDHGTRACRTPADCNGGCCALVDAQTATGVCADSAAGNVCLCLANVDCPGNDGCCQPFLDESRAPTNAQVCATQVENPGLFQCCTGGVTTCQSDLCCVHPSTGGEYCALPCSTDADCSGGTCQAGSPVALFGCGNGTYCGPGPGSSSSSGSSSSGAGGATGSSSSGTGGATGSSSSGTGGATGSCGGPPDGGTSPGDAGAGSGCHSPADCDGGCCALDDPATTTGTCVPGDAGTACLCRANVDCPGSGACCQPFLDDAGVPTPAQVCATAVADPGIYQCCTGGSTTCQGSLCCIHPSTGGEYCAPPCGTDCDCHGGHCTPGSSVDIFGCGNGTYCGP